MEAQHLPQAKEIESIIDTQSKEYLDNLPKFRYNFEDVLNLGKFLLSRRRLLVVSTVDTTLEATRIYNILYQLDEEFRNPINPDDIIYVPRRQVRELRKPIMPFLGVNNQTFLNWKQSRYFKTVNSSFKFTNLVIIEYSSLLENHESPANLSDLMTYIFADERRKVILIYHRKDEMDPQLQLFNLDYFEIVKKQISSISFNDLTKISQRQIAAQSLFMFKDAPTNLRNLLEIGQCYNPPKEIISRLNRIVKSDTLKALSSQNFAFTEISTFFYSPQFCDVNPAYLNVFKEISLENIILFLTNINKVSDELRKSILILINCSSHFKKEIKNKLIESSNTEDSTTSEESKSLIFSLENDEGQNKFLRVCKNNPNSRIYWIICKGNGYCLKKIYDTDFYIDRQFSSHVIDKSEIKNVFTPDCPLPDLFLFDNMINESEFCDFLDINTEIYDKQKNENIVMVQEGKNLFNFELNRNNDRPVHHITFDKEVNELIWTNSKGSLENLRNFITIKNVQMDELTLSKKEVIILGGPAGVGKCSCLISLLRHIPPTSWIIKRNFKDCKNLIQELPSVINVDVVASFLSADCQDRLFVSRLLADFLSNKISKSLYILFEDIDEILNDLERLHESEVKMVKIKQLGNILQFLKRKNVYIWLTSKSEKNIRTLEILLSSFSTNIMEIKLSDQEEFLINSWQAKLSLGCEISLNRQKELLLEHAQEVINMWQLGSKLHSEFVGIPFQLKVIQEVTELNVDNFNKRIYCSQEKFENLSKILKKFIRVNYEIFLENSFENYQKNRPSDPGNFRKYLDLHFGALAFKQIFPYSGLTLESYENLNFRNVHFLQSTLNGEFKFIHCIFEDYFAAVAIISWIMDSTFSIAELFVTEILIKPKYKVLRLFLNQLIKIAAASVEALENFAQHIIKYWKQIAQEGIIKNEHLLFHIIIEENLCNIALLFLNKSFLLTELIPFFVVRNTRGKTALFLAAENRLDVIVDIILKRFIDADTKSQQKIFYATLFSKSAYEDESTNKYLINKIKHLNENSKLEEELQETQILADSLFRTIPDNNINALKEQVQRIKNKTMLYYVILWTNDKGLTVLHLAASKGYVDIVQYLLQQGIPVDLLDQHGCTPLHRASECGSLETVECLKKHGSICNITNDTGMSPLAISAKFGHLNIVRSLIESGASWKEFDRNNLGPLEYTGRSGHLDIVDCLVEHGCGVNRQDKFGMTAIAWATKLGHLNVVKYLVSKQTDLSILDCHGRNLLQIAILSEQWTIVKYLIFCEVNINNMTYNGVSPLQMAVKMGNWDIVQLLIAEGAQTNVVDQYNFTPITYAAKEEKWSIVVHMIEQGAEIKDLEAEVLEIILKYVLCNDAVQPKPPTNPFNRQYNKFYNIIRLGNTDFLNLLIELEDLGNDSKREGLTQLLAEPYEELHLRNVPLSNKIKYCVEEKLVVLRGFSNVFKRSANTPEDNKKRVESIITEIKEIQKKYVLESSPEADQELLIRIRFITENIQILKHFLKVTYDSVPWEEMEFCLVNFMCFFIQCQDDDFCYRLVMDQNRIIMQLVNFMDPLLNIKYDKGKRPPNRLENIKNIKKKYPKLKNLFEDYNIIKDIYSLKRVSFYIKMALSVKNAEDEEIKPFAIQRCLQVIGESFKNTVESPNLSEEVNNFLLYFAPRNFKNVLTQLRDKLSHSHTLKERIEIENDLKVDNEFLESVQSDLGKIEVDIVDILSRKKHEALRMFATKIKDTNNISDIEQLTRYIRPCEFSDLDLNDYENVEIKKLKSLLLELREHVDDMDDEIISLHRTVLDDINDSKTLTTKYFLNGQKIYSFIETRNYVGLKNVTNNFLTSEQRRQKNQNWTLLTMTLLSSIKNKFSLECPSLYNQIVTILELIITQGQIKNIEKIKDMEEKNNKSIFLKIKQSAGEIFDRQENKNKSKQNTKMLNNLCENWNEGNIVTFLEKVKIKKGKNYVSNLIYNFDQEMQEFERNIQTKLDILHKYLKKDISSLKTNAVIVSGLEMLSLDVIDWLLETSRLPGHHTPFDDYSPVLIGKSLRNHLAHRNCLIDSLPFNTLTAIFSTIQKMSTKGDDPIFQETKSIDLHKNKHNNMINIVTRQSDIFKNLMEGNLTENDETKATDIYGKTALEYAIMSNKFDLVKVFLKKEKNFGTRCFFTAVKLGALLVIKGISTEIRDCRILSKALLIAAENDQKEVAMELLALGANIDIQDKFLRTPLDVAMENGHHDVADGLLNPENKVAIKINDIYNILYRAASRGYENVVKILVNLDSFKIVQPEAKLKALGLAAENGHENIVIILLKYILNVNAYLGSERPALYIAVENGQKDVVEVLLKHGADPNVPDTLELNNTSLHIACLNGHKNIVDLLISKKANINAKNINKTTPLHLAAASGLINIVETLIHHKADVNARTVVDSTPIIQAAFHNHRAIIEILVEKGANVNEKMKNELTALQVASYQGHEDTVISLLENNADYNAESWLTAVYLSALNGHLSVVQHLLNKYEDTATKNNAAQTAFFVAANNNHNDIVSAMLDYRGVDINAKDKDNCKTALNMAVRYGFINVVETLLNRGANIDKATDLKSAALKGHTDIVQILLDHGADINECPLLHIAAESNYVDMITLALDREAQINAKYTDDFSALHRAVLHGCLEIAQILLVKGAEVNAEGKNMITPLHLAAEFGFDKIALTLINRGANVNAVQTDNYFSVLEIAAKNGHEKIVRHLLENGANPNLEKDRETRTSLHLAASQGHLGVVSILLSYGADVNSLDEENFTALNLAVHEGHIDIVDEILDHNLDLNMHLSLLIADEFNHIDIVNLLLERGANKNEKFEDGRSVLHRAVENRHLEVVNVLLDYEADVNVKENNNVSPLHLAAENGYDEIALTLINRGANVNAVQTDNYFSVLEIAAKNGHEKIVRDLLENGADPNLEKIRKTRTSLHLAASQGHLGVVSILLSHGADVNALIERNYTALNLAVQNGHIDVVKEILDHDLYVNMHLSLLIAAEFNHVDIVIFLLERGANKNDRFKDGRSVLHRAVENRHLEVVNVLLDYGADVNVKKNNNISPLHIAAKNGYDEIALTLIKRGANVDAVQLDFALSSLHMAAENGHEKIVRDLLENGANPNLKEESKHYTALHLASFQGHSDVVSILVNQKEIEVDAMTKDNFTSLHLASREGHKVIVENLLEHAANYNMGLSLGIALEYDYKDIVCLILNKIVAVESSITINKVCPTMNGGIIFGCKNSEDMMTFCNLANDRMVNKFDIKEVNASNPKIQIVGITENLSEDELVQCLKLQNEPFIRADSECKILEYWHNSNNIFQAIVELDVATYTRLLRELPNKHLLVGYNSCVIYDAVEPLRCFSCSGYDHTSKNCTRQKACPKCSQEHKLSECKSSTVKCINCINTPSGSSGFDVNHAAWDRNCPVYKNQLIENRLKYLTGSSNYRP